MKIEFMQMLEKLPASYNINLTVMTPPFEGIENFDYGLRKALDPQFDWQDFGRLLFQQVPPKTLVFAQGAFELHFAFFFLPDQPDTLLCVGPWSSGAQSAEKVEWCEKNLDAAANQVIREYYNAVRVVDNDILKNMLYAMVSLLYPDGDLASQEWLEFMPLNFLPDIRCFDLPDFKNNLPAELVAERYAAENRVLDAVTQGDTATALSALEALARFRLKPRFSNPIRDQKNLTVILNTLLRKAIERASVHPYYIDQISTKYSLQSEEIVTEEDCHRVQRDMVREYCMYVQQYSLQQYSPLIQKVINHINLHLDSTLSLKSLAALCYISPSYLSNVFKQETGQTLTDYISTQRMARAANLLRTTNATVASVAEDVGILDVNYFTKLFKSATGLTPTRYRREKHDR